MRYAIVLYLIACLDVYALTIDSYIQSKDPIFANNYYYDDIAPTATIDYNVFKENSLQHAEDVAIVNSVENAYTPTITPKVFLNEQATYAEVFDAPRPIFFDNLYYQQQEVFERPKPSYEYDGIFLNIYHPEQLEKLSPERTTLRAFGVIEETYTDLTDSSPKARIPLTDTTLSIVSDIGIDITKEELFEVHANSDTTIRFDKFLISGIFAHYYDQTGFELVTEDVNYVFEGEQRNYQLGLINPPSFTAVSAEKITGIAVSNTEQNKNFIFESDPRYINLSHPAEVSVYLDDVLFEQKSFTAGRHQLPLSTDIGVFDIRVEIIDIYKRKKIYRFNYAGKKATNIPKVGQYLYFAGIGENAQERRQAYLGIEFGVDEFSKISFDAQYSATKISLGSSHYQALPFGDIVNNIVYLLNKEKEEQTIKFSSKLSIETIEQLSLSSQLTYEHTTTKSSAQLQLDALNAITYTPSDSLTLGAKLDYDATLNEWSNEFSAKYKFSNTANLLITYTAGDDAQLQISLNWTFGGDNEHSVNHAYNATNHEDNHSLNYTLNKRTKVNVQAVKEQLSTSLSHTGEVFQSNVLVEKNKDKKNKYNANTKFSLVAVKDAISIAPNVGNTGFAIFAADDNMQGSIITKQGGRECTLYAGDFCGMTIPANNEVVVDYDISNVPVDSILVVNQHPITVNPRGGALRIIKTNTLYYVLGRVVNNKNTPIDLLIGELVAEDNETRFPAFTNEQGEFELKLQEGTYTMYFKGFAPTTIVIDASTLQDEFINIGDIIVSELTNE